ncbi:MAG TPA: CocE/NonD family hydrolase [Actinomycetota bacterium]|nr:CocE/NonD family hydrolase [Actinomycetota bacterium]
MRARFRPPAVRSSLGLLVIASTALMAPTAIAASDSSPGWHTRPATYGIAITRNVTITMSDGVTLVADVYRPADGRGRPASSRFPVLLTQTPYNKAAGPLAFRTDYLIQRGYVQVIVDVRGTGGSAGTWDSFGPREQLDGKELVEWAASRDRPWSDGRVALHGTSYGAINQLFTAAQHPAGLKAAFPVVPMADSYRDVTASGGEIDASFIPSWLGLVTAAGLVPPTYSATDPTMAASTMADHVRGAVTFQGRSVVNAMRGGSLAYDGPFYRHRSPIEVIDRVHVPTFVVGGWYDLFQRGEPLLYQHLAANGVPTKLLMGPWYHITAGEGLPADGVPSLDELELHWFDHYVMGRADPDLARMAAVTYADLGTGHYRTASAWPPPQVHYRQLYLSGPASPGRPGSVVSTPPTTEQSDTMIWEPFSGVCTRSTVQWTAGAGASSPCATHNEGNDLTGPAYDLPVTRSLPLAGPISVGLALSTNGRDCMVTVRLEDVAPNGKSTQLTAGWNTISFRALDRADTVMTHGVVIRPYHPFTKASVLPVEAGHVYELWVEVFPTAATIAPGHRLRIAIQSADTPHLAWNLDQIRSQPGGVVSIHHDAEHPSVVVIPELG